jgi:hypothetical protein
MKKLEIQQMVTCQGGKLDQATVCGIAAGFAIVVPNPWSIGAALAVCLSGDR